MELRCVAERMQWKSRLAVIKTKTYNIVPNNLIKIVCQKKSFTQKHSINNSIKKQITPKLIKYEENLPKLRREWSNILIEY